MNKLYIAYWSSTGNTETMAEYICQGAKEAGADAEMVEMENISESNLLAENVFALGCPSMGSEELEDTVVEPFISNIEGKVNGKKILLFGSYGWGDGEWMRDWQERMEKAGAVVIGGEGVIANEEPDEEAEEKCKAAGKKLAESFS